MPDEPEIVEFRAGSLDEVVAAMDTLAAARRGWVNLQPAVEPEHVPDGSAMFGIFSGRGPAVPLGTWTPPAAARRGRVEPAMLGLQHGAGTKARPRLAELDHPVPDGWRVTQDHSRKGFVLALPETVANHDALAWLVGAAERLSAVPLTGAWRAVVYGREAG